MKEAVVLLKNVNDFMDSEEEEVRHEIVQPSDNLPVWIYLHEQDPVQYIAPHWHQSIELSYTLQGHIEQFTIGGQVHRTSPGQILVINTMEVHSIRMPGRSHEQGRALTLLFPYDWVKLYQSDIEDYEFRIPEIAELTGLQRYAYHLLQDKLKEVAAVYTKKPALSTIRLHILLLEILKILLENFLELRSQATCLPKTKQALERIQNIKSYIESSYQQDISLQEIADICFLSKGYVVRFFKEYMGMTIGDYINEVRAQHARDCLLHSQMNFTEIALSTGFSGLRTMNRALEKSYGLNARAIRTLATEESSK